MARKFRKLQLFLLSIAAASAALPAHAIEFRISAFGCKRYVGGPFAFPIDDRNNSSIQNEPSMANQYGLTAGYSGSGVAEYSYLCPLPNGPVLFGENIRTIRVIGHDSSASHTVSAQAHVAYTASLGGKYYAGGGTGAAFTGIFDMRLNMFDSAARRRGDIYSVLVKVREDSNIPRDPQNFNQPSQLSTLKGIYVSD